MRWLKNFADEREARRCLAQAERLADDWSDWSAVAKGWDELGETERAKNSRRKSDG